MLLKLSSWVFFVGINQISAKYLGRKYVIGVNNFSDVDRQLCCCLTERNGNNSTKCLEVFVGLENKNQNINWGKLLMFNKFLLKFLVSKWQLYKMKENVNLL